MRFFAAALLAISALPSLLLAATLPSRALLDVCASINVDLFADLGLDTGLLAPLLGSEIAAAAAAKLDVCLCLSALPLFLETNIVAKAAVKAKGGDIVYALLELLINLGGKHCTYPAHSTPVCEASNPCGFTCTDGYVLSGGKCVPPSTPSGKARRSQAVLTPTCEHPAELVCGTAHADSAGWECVNTQADLESCGGCLLAPPFPALALTTPKGTDCTAIPHVADVLCAAGGCVVQRCLGLYVPSLDATACVLDVKAAGRRSRR